MDTKKAILVQQWISDQKRQREHREKQRADESHHRDQARHNSEMARLEAKSLMLKEKEQQEKLRLKEKELEDMQRHRAEMIRLKEEEKREATSAREAERQEREKVRVLKQEIFDLRESLKKACKIADATERHDTLFNIRRDAAAIDISILEDITDKKWHSETLEVLDKNLAEVVAELGVDRTDLMKDLFSSCREVGELCCQMTEAEDRARRGRANTSGQRYADSAIEDAEDLFLEREDLFRRLEELVQEVEHRRSELGVNIGFLPDELQCALSEATRRQRNWRSTTFEFQCLIMLARVDGEINPSESRFLQRRAYEYLMSSKEADRLIQEMGQPSIDAFSGNEDAARALFKDLHRIAAADDEVDPKEIQLIARIGGEIGLSRHVMEEASMAARAECFDPIVEFQCLILLAKSGGEIDPAEMKLLQDFAAACGIGTESGAHIIQETKSLNGKAFSGDKKSAKRIIKGLYKIASADGNIDAGEMELIGKIGEHLGLSPSLVEGASRVAKAECFDHIVEFQCIVLLARSDGQIDPEETTLLHEVASTYGIDPESRDRLIQETESLNPKAFSGKEDVAKRIVQDLYRMSLANGNVSSEEAKWIGKIGSAIGLSKETIKGIITETKEAAKRADEEARRSQLESILVANPDYKPYRRAREAATNETSDDVAWGRGVVTWVVILALIAFLVWIFVLTPLWGKIYLACAAVTYLVCRLGGRRNGQSLLIAAIGPVALALVLMAIVSFSDSQRKK